MLIANEAAKAVATAIDMHLELRAGLMAKAPPKFSNYYAIFRRGEIRLTSFGPDPKPKSAEVENC